MASFRRLELIRRAYDKGYRAIAITDHVGLATQEAVVQVLVEECAQAMAKWDIIAIPGVEITHVPAEVIPEAAEQAKALGAKLVVVHGETIVEPVEPGTNASALSSPHVDILAHPGLLTLDEARSGCQPGRLSGGIGSSGAQPDQRPCNQTKPIGRSKPDP